PERQAMGQAMARGLLQSTRRVAAAPGRGNARAGARAGCAMLPRSSVSRLGMQARASVVAPTIALFLATFVAAMDVSIIATALPTVVGELGGLPLFGWAVAAYLLTSTVSMPLYGSLADRYGRRPVTITALGLFLLGSLLGGFANSMPELIAFRALQGLGGGGILTLTATIAGDLYPLEQRARVEGIISSIWGLAAILGPLIGSVDVSPAALPSV